MHNRLTRSLRARITFVGFSFLLGLGCAVVRSTLPEIDDVAPDRPLPIDGLWRQETNGVIFRVESGRIFPIQPYLLGRILIDTHQVVVRHLKQSGANQFEGLELTSNALWTASVDDDRTLLVGIESRVGPMAQRLAIIELDDPAWFDAQLATPRILPRPDPPADATAQNRNPITLSAIPGLNVDPAIFGHYYALVIGNDNYQDIEDLRTARADALAVAQVLEHDYGFSTTVLLDATREQMLLAFARLRKQLAEQDNLLVYYAGQSRLESARDEGYWLPVDAERENDVRWIANSTITSHFRALSAKHVLVIADSSFSGTLTRGLEVNADAPSPDIQRLAQRKARIVITSGGEQPVEDGAGNHSAFARALLDVLRENQGVLDATSLHMKIRRSVLNAADQAPEIAHIRQAGHNGGGFLFVRVAQKQAP